MGSERPVLHTPQPEGCPVGSLPTPTWPHVPQDWGVHALALDLGPAFRSQDLTVLCPPRNSPRSSELETQHFSFCQSWAHSCHLTISRSPPSPRQPEGRGSGSDGAELLLSPSIASEGQSSDCANTLPPT